MKNAPLTLREIRGPFTQLLNNLQGDNGQEWLDALKRFNRKENPWESKKIILKIDRTTPFDPVAFIDEGWSILEQDERSLKLPEVDLTKVNFETSLADRESSVLGEEKLKRLKETGYIRLDAKVFQTLWENQHLIPANWKEPTNGNTTYVFFDGTILQDLRGRCYVLCLCWDGDEWSWRCRWLDHKFNLNRPSAVVAS